MRSPVSLAPVLLTSGCLLVNPAYGDEDTDGSTAGGTTRTTAEPSSSGTTAGLTTTTTSDGSGSNSDGATTGGASSTGQATGSTGSTGCVEENLYPDADGDGYGVDPPVTVCAGARGYAPQGGDCDDAAGSINPGAAELCDPNKVDEDCDGLKNESSPMNASCDGCGLAEYNAHTYWFCDGMVTWDAARQLCLSFGAADLVIVEDMAENQWIFPQTPATTTWLGGRDTNPQVALDYTWWNGAPLTFNGFAKVDFDNGCIAMPDVDGSQWRDRNCAYTYGYVCESI